MYVKRPLFDEPVAQRQNKRLMSRFLFLSPLPFCTQRSMFEEGNIPAKKPTIIGTNADDISIFFGLTPIEVLPEIAPFHLLGPVVSRSAMKLAVRRLLPNAGKRAVEEIMEIYGAADENAHKSFRSMLYAFGTDGYFACPSNRIARAMGDRAYRYLFSATLSSNAALTQALGWERRPFALEIIRRFVRPWYVIVV